jgi:hypothetical protein
MICSTRLATGTRVYVDRRSLKFLKFPIKHGFLGVRTLLRHRLTKTRGRVNPERACLLEPVTSVTIRRLRGILKRKPGDTAFDEEWAEHEREEKELEEAKDVCSTSDR